MDSTPIYTELQQTLIDPEDDNWGTSSPPEFASALHQQAAQHAAQHAAHSQEQASVQEETQSEVGWDESPKKHASRSGGRRHRAED
ncbi:hypothetical protein FHX42_000472 [Saccharopolyspora lacisalsi]|uniref:Uncharacterized protein n=1 Tax=Halosaccharopolyspora lacisalsi TaxID=1000566 RepID=A0A839DPZ6_9PSEU|nr:hypothetical protein [Halosaccharopolyspora lacisalsi]MBA8823143.1 hypothetical protein [Halosaccharopolyspora lacisalsi]